MTGAVSLESALHLQGIPCRVEAHERLAVLIPLGEIDLAADDVRASAVELARSHGFTHVALELREDEVEALPRD